MTTRTVMNITRGPLIVNDSGYAIGAREVFTFDDATTNADTLAMVQKLISQNKVAAITAQPGTDPTTPDPTPPPGGASSLTQEMSDIKIRVTSLEARPASSGNGIATDTDGVPYF